MGNFFVDMWRVVMYMFLPVAFVLASFFLQQGSPMTLPAHISFDARTRLDGYGGQRPGKQQTIVVGPLAAFVPIKQFGTNGGGFYGMNSAHPFENPTALTNFLSCVAMMLFPFSLVLMYGRMLETGRHWHGDLFRDDVADDRHRRLACLFRYVEAEPRADRTSGRREYHMSTRRLQAERFE